MMQKIFIAPSWKIFIDFWAYEDDLLPPALSAKNGKLEVRTEKWGAGVGVGVGEALWVSAP